VKPQMGMLLLYALKVVKFSLDETVKFYSWLFYTFMIIL